MEEKNTISKEFIISIFLVFIGAAFGVFFPDFDQTFLKINSIIQHRSIITHSCLLGLIFLWLSKRDQSELFRFFAVGIFIGIAVHLSFDLFPRRWWGGALIYIPLIGNLRSLPFDGDLLPPLFSSLWILGNIWFCLVQVYRIMSKNNQYLIASVFIMLFIFLIASTRERNFWLPFFTLSICFLISFREKEIIDKLKAYWKK